MYLTLSVPDLNQKDRRPKKCREEGLPTAQKRLS